MTLSHLPLLNMKAWVADTDKDWYRFLRQRPDLEKVNFWRAGGNRRLAGEVWLHGNAGGNEVL